MRISEAISKTVVIYPGRFHPFHKGHASVYAYLKNKFDTVYITTSNKIDPPKSPFSFAEKRAMMVHAGIPAGVIVQSTQPYRAEEILRNFDPSTTSVAFAVSEKDMEEDPRFSFRPKKDGSPSYFQAMPKDEGTMVGFDTHGYITTVPTLDFTVSGEPMRSATELRQNFAKADDETQKSMITDLYGAYDEDIHNIMRNKIKEHTDAYAQHIMAAESVFADLSTLYEHKQFDTATVLEHANKIVDRINSIPVVETLDYLDPNDAMDSIVAVPGVGTMSIKGLMSNILEKMKELTAMADKGTPTAFRDIRYRMDSNIIGVMMDALVNAFDDIENIRRKGGANSKSIPKNVFDSVLHMHEAWSAKYKRSINCNNPKGFSQRAHCAGRNKTEDTITEYVFQSIPLRVLDNLSSRKDNKPFPIKTGDEPDEVFNVTPEIARKFMNVYYQKEPEVQKAIDKTLNNPRKFIELFTNIMLGKKVSGAAPTDIAPDKLTADINEAGVGIINKQNTTADVKPGETERQSKKLALGGKPKLLHKSAAKNSDPNTLFNLGLAEIYTPLAIAIMEGGHELPELDEDMAGFLDNLLAKKKTDAAPKTAIDQINSQLAKQRKERESELKAKLYKLTRQAMKLPAGSEAQRRIIDAMNPVRKALQLNPIAVTEAVSQVDIEQLERFADKMFAKVGIDVEFGRHFMDRVNDERNGKPITPSELTRLFKQTYQRHGKPIAQMGPEQQAVMKDMRTDVNIPFMLQWDADNNELDLIAKTVMRKQDFKTSNREFAVEEVIPMLYHATYKPFLDSILKNGLGGKGAQTQWEDSKPGYVYLAKDPEVAVSHAEANEEVPDEYIDNIVVLRIDASQLDHDSLEDDPNVQDDDSTLAYKGVIPTSAFTVQESKQNLNTSNREFAVERGGINVPFASGMIAQIVPHRALKVKKSTPGRLSYDQPKDNRKRNN